jgi:hypothetical protein
MNLDWTGFPQRTNSAQLSGHFSHFGHWWQMNRLGRPSLPAALVELRATTDRCVHQIEERRGPAIDARRRIAALFWTHLGS